MSSSRITPFFQAVFSSLFFEPDVILGVVMLGMNLKGKEAKSNKVKDVVNPLGLSVEMTEVPKKGESEVVNPLHAVSTGTSNSRNELSKKQEVSDKKR